MYSILQYKFDSSTVEFGRAFGTVHSVIWKFRIYANEEFHLQTPVGVYKATTRHSHIVSALSNFWLWKLFKPAYVRRSTFII